MEPTSPSLGDQIARLRSNAQGQENCAWIPDAIHALITAIFARIFTRLEQIIALWQAGCLPVRPACATRHHSPHPAAPSGRISVPRRAGARHATGAAPSQAAARTPHPSREPRCGIVAAPLAVPPAPVPRARPDMRRGIARAPPSRPICRKPPAPTLDKHA